MGILKKIIPILILFGVVIIKFSLADEEEFTELYKKLIGHSDIIILTDIQPGRTAPFLYGKHQVSFQGKRNISESVVRDFRIHSHLNTLNSVDNFNVMIIIDFDEPPDILEAIMSIGNSPIYTKDRSQVTILVIWPEFGISEGEIETRIIEQFTEAAFNFTLDSELFVGFRINSSVPSEGVNFGALTFYELYTINNQLAFQPLPGMNSALKLCHDQIFCPSLIERRSNFRNKTLNCEAVDDPEVDDDIEFERGKDRKYLLNKHGQHIFKNGFSVNLLWLFQSKFNFSYNVLRTEDEHHFNNETQKYVGLVQDVVDGRADIGIFSVAMTSEKADLVSFLPTTYSDKVSAFFKNPSINAVRDIFMQPFQPTLWAAIFATWLVLAFTMILFSIIRKRYRLYEFDPKDTSGVPEPDFTHDSLIWSLATCCQQGWDDHPVAGSLRTIFISGSFTGVVAYAAYGAAIVSTLSLKIEPIKFPSDLLRSNLKFGVRTGFVDSLQVSPEENQQDVLGHVLKKIQNEKGIDKGLSSMAGYTALNKNPFAFVSIADDFYNSIKKDIAPEKICDIREINIIHQSFPTSPILPKGSRYKEFFKHLIITIHARGILWRLKDTFSYTRRCIDAADQGKALGILDVFTAYMVLAGGYILSFSFLLFEKLIHATTTSKIMYIR